MDTGPILEIAGWVIYIAMAFSALLGAFYVILLWSRIRQKRFSGEAEAGQFLGDIREHLNQKNFDPITEMCDSPPFWSKAVPQLILVALANRHLPINKLRRTVAENFERDVLADLEYSTSWISTVVKSAPMLGLLGTVVGMINAFKGMAAMSAAGTDPAQLADDISFALFTTALGLSIAIPLVLAGNMIHIRIGKLQDSVQQHIGAFINELEAATADAGR